MIAADVESSHHHEVPQGGPLVCSPFLRFVRARRGRRTFVYHTLFGNPRILNEMGVRLLRLFTDARRPEEVASQVDGNATALLDELVQIRFLVPPGMDERALIHARRDELVARVAGRQTIDHISLSVSEDCNFGCGHCMFHQPDTKGKRLPIYQKPARTLNMDWPTAKVCVDSYLALLAARGETHARVHFGNAEPLLNWSLVAQVLDYCADMDGFAFDFAINTNLSLLTHEMCEVLKRHQVKIATSLDGVGEANDAIRVTRGGKGTFEIILDKMDLLDALGYPLDGVSVTVTGKNFHAVDVELVEFAAGRGMTSLAFDYDLIGFSSVPVEERVEKVLRLKTCANSRGIYFGGTWSSPFRKLMTTSMLDQPHAFCAAVEGRAMVFNPDGSLKTCGYTTTQVGHLDLEDVFGSAGGLSQLVGARYPGTDPYCRGCMIDGPCGGQCHATREVASRDSMDVFEEMCSYYRHMTDALIQDYLGAFDDPRELELRTRYL